MEPKLSAPNLGPEQMPMGYGQNLERPPQSPTPETGIERGHEQFEQRSEAAPMVAAPVLPPVVIPAVPAPVTTTSTAAPAVDDLPMVANDDDLIEREWVDKAKKIIVETKDDPYRREQEVGRLQVDYLKKRYGKELGSSS
jgi:hypothetical protein